MRRRVLVVSDYGWPTGGTEQFTRSLLDTLRSAFDTELLTWSGSAAPYPDGITRTAVSNGDVLQVWSSFARADAVVIVTSFNMRLLARQAEEVLSEMRVPTITVLQTSAHSTPAAVAAPHQARSLTSLIIRSDLVIGASTAVIDSINGLMANARRSAEPLLIENGARLTDLTPRRRGRRRLLYIGRPTPSKGYPVFLRLADALRDDNVELHANTVSIPPDVRHHQIVYSWCLPDAELLALFAVTDLVIAPYWRADGLPLALLEALNCGVPVLGFDSPAVGPLLRRHSQIAVTCETKHLIAAVRCWRAGELRVHPPRPGAVRSLAAQTAGYVDLVDRLLKAQTGPATSLF